jgi:hypothetical protein
MNTTFLEYYKNVLDKVSFDPRLFSKEYYKALRMLQSNEVNELNDWLRSRGLYPVVFKPASLQPNLSQRL